MSSDPAPSIGELYLTAHRSFVALARTLSPDEWATPVPCCPSWRVRDVLSHVAGITDDLVHGRIDGVATDAWTAAQVERWRDTPVEVLLAQWETQAPEFAAALDALGESRPPVDCHSHEHDVRHAIGRPGSRDNPVVTFAVATISTVPPGPGVVRGISGFELFRSRLGRRSRGQVRAYDWVEPPSDEVLDDWFLFGPSELDITE